MIVLPFSDEAIQEAIAILKSGGVIAHATETCYGLACDLSNTNAVTKLFAIKQRPDTQPVSALFSSVDQAKEYVLWNDRAEELAKQYLPGPLTIILPMRSEAPNPVFPTPVTQRITKNEKRKTIGVRISSSPIAQSLVQSFGRPISTTSANLHTHSNPYSANDIVQQFTKHDPKPDLILDSGILPQNPPSTVIDCTSDNLEQKRSGGLHII